MVGLNLPDKPVDIYNSDESGFPLNNQPTDNVFTETVAKIIIYF
jgi:hypothetical protein